MSNSDGDIGSFSVQVFAGAGLLVFVSAITGRLLGADAGSYADWLAAIATLAAFIAAGFAAWYAARAFSIEAGRETRLEDTLRSQQASLVAGWTQPVMHVTYETGTPFNKFRAVKVWLRNGSDTPVTQFRFSIHVVYATGFTSSDPLLHTLVYEQTIGVLPPASHPLELTIVDLDVLASATESWNLPLKPSPELRVRISFQDASSNWWQRSTGGVLTPTKPLGSSE